LGMVEVTHFSLSAFCTFWILYAMVHIIYEKTKI
jgi:hypothetical protein